MVRRRWIIAAAVVLALLATTVTVTAVALPAVAATACPQCYGLTSLGGGLYVERDDQAGDYRAMVATAEQRVGAFFGAVTVEPRVLICATGGCYRRIGGGGEKGQAIRSWSLLLAPSGANETIATHELSHLEFYARLGDAQGRVPRWFHEGLAVVISEDARYLDDGACRIPVDQARAVAGIDWQSTATERSYLQAGCVVSDWLARSGGSTAVLDLIGHLRGGGDFTVA